MTRKIVSIILTSKPNYDPYAFKYFVLNLNKIQSYYGFVFPEIHKNYYSSHRYDENALLDLFEEKVGSDIRFENEPQYIINIITSKIEGNYFFVSFTDVAFVTTFEWNKYFSPPSLFEYLLHCIIASLLFMNEDLDLGSSHRDTKGCCLDFTLFKKDDKVDIALGYICDECKRKIINVVGEQYCTEISNIVSREWIGDINNFGSVAYNLKNFFKFNINRDSGFNKTTWDKIKEHFYEIPGKIILLIAGMIIGAIGTLLISLLGNNSS